MRHSNKTKLIVTFAIFALILILILIVVMLGNGGRDNPFPNQTDTTLPQILDPILPTGTVNPDIGEKPTATDPVLTGPGGTDPDVTEDPTQDAKPTQPQPSQPGNETCSFPYTISNSNLVIEQVNSYDGIFFEDGSDREVSDVTAIVLTNTGKMCIEYVRITIRRDGVPMCFVASSIEAGGTVVVLEADSKKFANGDYTDCTAEISTVPTLEMSPDRVRVEENSKGSLIVTNISDEDIPCIRIFYKFYMDDVDVYVGGITYTAKVLDLKAGDSCTVTPSHYFPDFSKVVMIKTYETKD